MRIGVISDTHADFQSFRRAVEVLGEVDAWFHLGDLSQDIYRLADELKKPIYAVQGNCDYSDISPISRVEELGGKRFFLTHGHRYAVGTGTQLLVEEALKNNCDAAIYGHTHIPLIEYGRAWVLNPGSTSRPLGGHSRSCALITIDGDNMKFDIITL